MFNWFRKKEHQVKLKGIFEIETEGGIYRCKNVEIHDWLGDSSIVSIRGDIIKTTNELFDLNNVNFIWVSFNDLISLKTSKENLT